MFVYQLERQFIKPRSQYFHSGRSRNSLCNPTAFRDLVYFLRSVKFPEKKLNKKIYSIENIPC